MITPKAFAMILTNFTFLPFTRSYLEKVANSLATSDISQLFSHYISTLGLKLLTLAVLVSQALRNPLKLLISTSLLNQLTELLGFLPDRLSCSSSTFLLRDNEMIGSCSGSENWSPAMKFGFAESYFVAGASMAVERGVFEDS